MLVPIQAIVGPIFRKT